MDKENIEKFLRDHDHRGSYDKAYYLHKLYKRKNLVSEETAKNLHYMISEEIGEYVKEHKNHYVAYVDMMPIYIDLGRKNEVKKYLDEYARESEKDSRVWNLELSAKYYQKMGEESEAKKYYEMCGDITIKDTGNTRDRYDRLKIYQLSKEFYQKSGMQQKALEDKIAEHILTRYDIDLKKAKEYFKDLSIKSYERRSDDQLRGEMVYHRIKNGHGSDWPEEILETINEIKNPKVMKDIMSRELKIEDMLEYMKKILKLSDSVSYERRKRCDAAQDHVLHTIGRLYK